MPIPRPRNGYAPCDLASTAAIANLASCPTAQDGGTLVAGMRFLVKNTASLNGVEAVHGKRNGVYRVASVTGANCALQRDWDANTTGETVSGYTVSVIGGAVNAKSLWMLTTAGAIVLGTTALTFELLAQVP